jgi:hypothetical protein
MRLDELCATFASLDFPRLEEVPLPARDSVLELRARVQDALAGDDFLLDCIDHELEHLARGRLRIGLQPFFTEPHSGTSFSFVYWRPGETTGPHEHTTWSISAVCHNRLDVETFDREQSYRRRALVPKNIFKAGAGEVGYMYGPAIHSPINTSDEWSMSVHVNGARDGLPVGDTEPLPMLVTRGRFEPGAAIPAIFWIARERARRHEADLLARILCSRPSPQSRALLARCARFTSSAMTRTLASTLPEVAQGTMRLERVHPDASFTVEHEGSQCRVVVAAPAGPTEVFRINDLAHAALLFASSNPVFDVGAMPGDLTREEQVAIADMLGDIGLFRRIEA